MPDRKLIRFDNLMLGDIIYQEHDSGHWYYVISDKRLDRLYYFSTKIEREAFTINTQVLAGLDNYPNGRTFPTTGISDREWDNWCGESGWATRFKFFLLTKRKPDWRV